MYSTDLLVWGITIHLVIDWVFQNDWMARNKDKPSHSAAWVHSALHGWGMSLIFPWSVALGIGLLHLLIDMRKPLIWWGRVYHQTNDPQNPVTLHVTIWRDQVVHIVVIALAAILCGR